MENNYENVEVVNEAEAPTQTPVEVPVEAPVEVPVEAPAQTPANESVVQKIQNLPLKMIAILSGAAVALILTIVIVVSVFTNTYKTPLNLMMDRANEKKASKILDAEIDTLNGLCEKEYKALEKLMQKRDDYDEDEVEEEYEEYIDEMKEEYGKNYKYSYEITDREKIDKDELRTVKKRIKNYARQIEDILDEMEDYDSDDWEDLADELGLKKSQAKKLEDILEDVYDELKSVKVTKGYELCVEVTLDGKKLDEPEVEEETICVYKVNGRWISEEALSNLYAFLYILY